MAAPAYTGNVNNVVLPAPKDLPTVGGMYWGPLTAAVPDSAFTIASSMAHLGFVGAEGVDDKEDRNTKKIFDWGGDTVAIPQENFAASWTFTLLEFLNPEVAKLNYRIANVTTVAATTGHGAQLSILQTSDTLDWRTWLLDTYSPGGKRVQFFKPMGRVQSKDTLKIARTDVLASRVTVEFMPDATGRYGYIRTDDGILSA
jgi:hypothetical protein